MALEYNDLLQMKSLMQRASPKSGLFLTDDCDYAVLQ